MITSDLLLRIPLLANVPLPERETIASRAADVVLQAGEWLLREGETPSFHMLLSGRVAVHKAFGGTEQVIGTFGEGDYFGEVPLLLGTTAVAGIRALEPLRVARLEPDDFHELLLSCKVLNAQLMQTMAQRVERLQQVAAEPHAPNAMVVGRRMDLACYDLRDFLSRNHVPFTWVDPDAPGAAARLPADFRESDAGPSVLTASGRRLDAPSFRVLADAVGLQTVPREAEYDVAVVGCGPAGLAAAVYGSSEGLSTLAMEQVAPGGQAGTSSRIENYLGFPTGLSGDELSMRAWQQARRFGTEMVVARSIVGIRPGAEGGLHEVVLDCGASVRCRAVVLATGVAWRRLEVPGADALVGRGVYYGAARTEALGTRGRDIYLIGGGNSAGQAAMLFSSYARTVTLLVRGGSLGQGMSRYLVDQLAAKANVHVRLHTQVVEVEGGDRLEAIVVESGPERRRERLPTQSLFALIGARADTGWLPDAVVRDAFGFVCTGRDVLDVLAARGAGEWPRERDPYLLETSVPGIFAAGDVRHGSVKRVAAGVGEGSMSIAFVHEYLAELAAARSADGPTAAAAGTVAPAVSAEPAPIDRPAPEPAVAGG
ncbi:MAG: cyclic nucleotide-binding protein [Gemmatimonadetes bacterium]|nr:cyclic nucleotide-binding protein [Gemmatimonadota bacterium]